MGTKTVDETGAKTGAEAETDEEKTGATDLTKTDEVTETEAVTEVDADTEAVTEVDADTEAVTEVDADTEAVTEVDADTEADDLDEAFEPVVAEGPTGVGQGAGAVVSAVLGLVSLTGSWIGNVAAQKESLVSKMENSAQSSSVSTLLKEGYGDVWNVTALYGGMFALAALIVGVVVLIRPAFGAPGKPQAAWIKSVSWAGVTLGVIGLLLAVLKYTDLLVSLPPAS